MSDDERLPDGGHADPDEPWGVRWPRAVGYGDPAVLAVTALALAVLSVGGLGLLNGTAFVGVGTFELGPGPAVLLAGAVGSGLALVPVLLGVLAGRRTHPGDPAWVLVAARAAVLVGLLSVVLRLIGAAIAFAASGNDQFGFYY